MFGSGRMDLYNNEIGRALATATFLKHKSVEELLQYAADSTPKRDT